MMKVIRPILGITFLTAALYCAIWGNIYESQYIPAGVPAEDGIPGMGYRDPGATKLVYYYSEDPFVRKFNDSVMKKAWHGSRSQTYVKFDIGHIKVHVFDITEEPLNPLGLVKGLGDPHHKVLSRPIEGDLYLTAGILYSDSKSFIPVSSTLRVCEEGSCIPRVAVVATAGLSDSLLSLADMRYYNGKFIRGEVPCFVVAPLILELDKATGSHQQTNAELYLTDLQSMKSLDLLHELLQLSMLDRLFGISGKNFIQYVLQQGFLIITTLLTLVLAAFVFETVTATLLGNLTAKYEVTADPHGMFVSNLFANQAGFGFMKLLGHDSVFQLVFAAMSMDPTGSLVTSIFRTTSFNQTLLMLACGVPALIQQSSRSQVTMLTLAFQVIGTLHYILAVNFQKTHPIKQLIRSFYHLVILAHLSMSVDLEYDWLLLVAATLHFSVLAVHLTVWQPDANKLACGKVIPQTSFKLR